MNQRILLLTILSCSMVSLAYGPASRPVEPPATQPTVSPTENYAQVKAIALAALIKQRDWIEATADLRKADRQSEEAGSEQEKNDARAAKQMVEDELSLLLERYVYSRKDVQLAEAAMLDERLHPLPAPAVLPVRAPARNPAQNPAIAPAGAAPAPPANKPSDHLVIGMTVEQVRSISHGTMTLVSEDAGGTQVYEAHVGPMQRSPLLGNRVYWNARKYVITFRDGQLESYIEEP